MTEPTRRCSASGPVPHGSKCEVVSLDARYNKKGDYEIKPSTAPLNVHEREGEGDWADYALILTRYFDQNGKKEKHVLKIRSPHILEALKSVASYYPGAPIITEREVTYETPYRLLFHCYDDLQLYRNTSEDDSAKLHISLLLRVIRQEMGGYIDELATVLPAKKITFPLLWAIFRPGTMIFTETYGAPEQYRVYSITYSRDQGGAFLKITCEQIDFDGKRFRTTKKNLRLSEFLRVVDISSLSVYPLQFHLDPETTTRSLIERGHKWFNIQRAAPRTMTYTGICTSVDRSWRKTYDEARKLVVTGRVVVDNATFGIIHPNNDPAMGENILWADGDLTDDNAVLCSAFVRGYSLNKRVWGNFNIGLLKEIEWSTDAFQRLILRPESKKAIKALVMSFVDTPSSKIIPDLVQGKGLGMVFLLHGPPGVGKTLTAETIAEHLRRPLYVVSGGELGVTPDSAEKKLSRVMEIATVWKAVVLIDEADIFLQKRDLENLGRNSLVAIFLRQLEYYEGLMFLTTNRVSCIDDAFRSRIDIALNYPDLSEAMRRQLWEASLRSLDPDTLDIDLETALPQLEKEQMNGREIRKTIKAATLMASYYGEKLTLDRLYVLMGFRMVGSLPETTEEFDIKPGGAKRQRIEGKEGERLM